jgi:hypothetical protein
MKAAVAVVRRLDWGGCCGCTWRIFETINASLADRGLLRREGTMVDATLIAAPPSVKNRDANLVHIRHAADQHRRSGTKRPTTNPIVLIIRLRRANSLMPSADHLGARKLIRKPDIKVPSSRSAPPHRKIQSQKPTFNA